MAKTLSGPVWVARFPTSKSPNDLVDPFKTNVQKFLAALKAAGATVSIAATRRPKERAFLMHFSFRMAREDFDPEQVPPMARVEIDWVHRDAAGAKSVAESKKAAEQMVAGYEIVRRPSLTSHHIEGIAIDMDIAWTAAELKIADAAGQAVSIKTSPKSGQNSELQRVGGSYGVLKLLDDPPHWSADGR